MDTVRRVQKRKKQAMLITVNTTTGDGTIDQGALLSAMSEIDREIATRQRVYPNWIAAGKIKEREASLRVAALVIARSALAAMGRGMITSAKTVEAEVVAASAPTTPAATVVSFPAIRGSDLPADRAERTAYLRQRFANTETARAACIANGGPSGHIPCPICGKGTLNYAIAPNGHIRAACSTDNCLSWIE
jgi:hypothetical protein